jgi:hypothetical protein
MIELSEAQTPYVASTHNSFFSESTQRKLSLWILPHFKIVDWKFGIDQKNMSFRGRKDENRPTEPKNRIWVWSCDTSIDRKFYIDEKRRSEPNHLIWKFYMNQD